jgi:hypothetical protein
MWHIHLSLSLSPSISKLLTQHTQTAHPAYPNRSPRSPSLPLPFMTGFDATVTYLDLVYKES